MTTPIETILTPQTHVTTPIETVDTPPTYVTTPTTIIILLLIQSRKLTPSFKTFPRHDIVEVEIHGAMIQIEIAKEQNCHNIWLDKDSTLVLLVFKYQTLIPRKLNNRWYNCLKLIISFNFIVTNIYQKENHCAVCLVNINNNLMVFYHGITCLCL